MKRYTITEDRHPVTLDIANRFGKLMMEGKLSNALFDKYNKTGLEPGLPYSPLTAPLIVRDAFIANYGFFVATTEWIEQVTEILQCKQPVLEVCAGTGILAKIMRRKLEWIATDSNPAGDYVVKMDALDAIDHYQPKTIFASWVDLNNDLDEKISNTGYPFMMVGEPSGGCTGSTLFWDNHKVCHISKIYPYFVDAVSWFCIHDTTWLVNWDT